MLSLRNSIQQIRSAPFSLSEAVEPPTELSMGPVRSSAIYAYSSLTIPCRAHAGSRSCHTLSGRSVMVSAHASRFTFSLLMPAPLRRSCNKAHCCLGVRLFTNTSVLAQTVSIMSLHCTESIYNRINAVLADSHAVYNNMHLLRLLPYSCVWLVQVVPHVKCGLLRLCVCFAAALCFAL